MSTTGSIKKNVTFTEAMTLAVGMASNVAAFRGHDSVDPDDVLIAMVSSPRLSIEPKDCAAVKILKRHGIIQHVETVEEHILAMDTLAGHSLKPSIALKKTIEESCRVACALRTTVIGTEHFILAMKRVLVNSAALSLVSESDLLSDILSGR